jgi:STIMATE family
MSLSDASTSSDSSTVEIFGKEVEYDDDTCDLTGFAGTVYPILETFLLMTSGYMIQVGLCIVILVVLLIKWGLEKPRRSPLVFFMDTSKQCYASIMGHFYNIWFSTFINTEDNECKWYVLLMLFDATANILMNYGFLTMFEYISEKHPALTFQSGYYDPEHVFRSYCFQAALWVLIVFISKSITFCVVLLVEDEITVTRSF